MDIEALLKEKIKIFEDVKKNLGALSQQIGALTEQQRAIYNQGLELKGQIDAILEIRAADEKALAGSKTAKLTLPEGVKPVVLEEAKAEAPTAEAAAPVLEVQ